MFRCADLRVGPGWVVADEVGAVSRWSAEVCSAAFTSSANALASSARASRQSVPPFTEASVDRSSESYAFSTGESAEIVGASEVSL